jgi:molybdenum cofactor guanylyltransferase
MVWVDRHPNVQVAFEPHNVSGVLIDPFFNANTPEDFAQAAAVAEELGA